MMCKARFDDLNNKYNDLLNYYFSNFISKYIYILLSLLIQLYNEK